MTRAKFQRTQQQELSDDILSTEVVAYLHSEGWQQICRHCGGDQTQRDGHCFDCGEVF